MVALETSAIWCSAITSPSGWTIAPKPQVQIHCLNGINCSNSWDNGQTILQPLNLDQLYIPTQGEAKLMKRLVIQRCDACDRKWPFGTRHEMTIWLRIDKNENVRNCCVSYLGQIWMDFSLWCNFYGIRKNFRTMYRKVKSIQYWQGYQAIKVRKLVCSFFRLP